MAMCRGNQQLKCGSEELGSSYLESGIMMGTENDVRSRSVQSTLPENWHDYFHTYTLIWTPGNKLVLYFGFAYPIRWCGGFQN